MREMTLQETLDVLRHENWDGIYISSQKEFALVVICRNDGFPETHYRDYGYRVEYYDDLADLDASYDVMMCGGNYMALGAYRGGDFLSEYNDCTTFPAGDEPVSYEDMLEHVEGCDTLDCPKCKQIG